MFLFSTIYKGWQNLKFNKVLYGPLSLSIISAITGHMVHMQVDTFDSRPAIQLLWINAALIVAIYNIQKTYKPNKTGIKYPMVLRMLTRFFGTYSISFTST